MDINRSNYKSYIFTGIKESCSGCGACAQICSKNALSMQRDEEGFLYPVRDSNTCINCGLCDKRCPVVSDESNDDKFTQHCFLATTTHSHFYQQSASIGICTMMADSFSKKGGVVYGSFLDEKEWLTYHKRVEDKNGIESIRNSKYIQSDTKQTYSEVKKDLSEGRKVLFIGTPCQIAGLKSFLNKQYINENLCTIDLFCHGVCSPALLTLEVNYWQKKFNSRIENFRFRSKRVYQQSNGGMVNFDILKNGRKKHIERFAGSSPTYHCFAYSGDGNSYNMRLSCYCCPFRSKERYADISVGDPWFVRDSDIDKKELKSSNIIRSLYSVNTKRGNNYISSINSLLIQQELPVHCAFVQPAVLNVERKIPHKRAEIFKGIYHSDYGRLIESILNCNLDKEHFKFVISYRKKQVKNIIKNILIIIKLYGK